MKNRNLVNHYEPVPYPVDEKGIPIRYYDLDDREFHTPLTGYERKNNHHEAFFARMFGQFVVSQTFRDLQAMQIEMPVHQHTYLHRRYTAPKMPPLNSMMEVIEREYENEGQLHIYNDHIKKYESFDITESKWDQVKQEYGRVKKVNL